MSGQLTGRTVSITGAGRGIGAATAAACVAAGAKVLIGDIDLDVAEETAQRLGASVAATHLDVTDTDSVAAFIDLAEQTFGSLDVYINNAGVMPLSGVLDEDDETIDRIFAINTRGMIHGTRAVARRMLPRGKGHIINVASTAGKAGLAGGATYCASKAAVVQYTEGAYAELAKRHKTALLPFLLEGIGEQIDGVRAQAADAGGALVVLTSDHGDQMGDHWLIEKLGWWDESYHVPLIVRDPRPEADARRGAVLRALLHVPPGRLRGAGLVPAGHPHPGRPRPARHQAGRLLLHRRVRDVARVLGARVRRERRADRARHQHRLHQRRGPRHRHPARRPARVGP